MTMQHAMQFCQMSACTTTRAASRCAPTDAAAAVSVFVIPEGQFFHLRLA